MGNSSGQMATFWGQSSTSYDDAVREAVAAAKAALPRATLDWFEVIEFRGGIVDGNIEYQISIRVGYS